MPHESVDGHPGEKGDVGAAAAPEDAFASRGGHGPVGPPDPHGEVVVADDYVPLVQGGEPTVDALRDQLVAVLRLPSDLRRRHGDAGHRGPPFEAQPGVADRIAALLPDLPARLERRILSRLACAFSGAGRTDPAPAGRPAPELWRCPTPAAGQPAGDRSAPSASGEAAWPARPCLHGGPRSNSSQWPVTKGNPLYCQT